MTRKTTKTTKPAGKRPKRLSLSKLTLRDLSPRGIGPLGGVVPPYPESQCRTCSCRAPC